LAGEAIDRIAGSRHRRLVGAEERHGDPEGIASFIRVTHKCIGRSGYSGVHARKSDVTDRKIGGKNGGQLW
jgi:hypothetical protein